MTELLNEFFEQKVDKNSLIPGWQLLIESKFLYDHVVVTSKGLLKTLLHLVCVLLGQLKRFSLLLYLEDEPLVNLLHALVKKLVI